MKTDFFAQYQKEISHFISQALAEDLGDGDHSANACLPEQAENKAQLIAKEDGLIAGLTLAEKIFKQYDPNLTFKPFLKEGDTVSKGSIVFEVFGNARALLATERLVLNCMQRMSGIAHKTHQLQQKIKHTQCRLLDTRKTTPNFRLPEKWAVHIGGGTNHRMGLYDAIMIKDNHIDFCRSLSDTLKKTKSYLEEKGMNLPVVVEIRSLKELEEALHFQWIDRLLLDNHSADELRGALQQIDRRFPTEASGNITDKNIVEMAETGVDFLSLGALTYNTSILDLSLKAKKK
ncbi:MAG: carboxylating nicotinate-nucleotide diphosphorylase [Flavobacteriaceae bacterium]